MPETRIKVALLPMKITAKHSLDEFVEHVKQCQADCGANDAMSIVATVVFTIPEKS